MESAMELEMMGCRLGPLKGLRLASGRVWLMPASCYQAGSHVGWWSQWQEAARGQRQVTCVRKPSLEASALPAANGARSPRHTAS